VSIVYFNTYKEQNKSIWHLTRHQPTFAFWKVSSRYPYIQLILPSVSSKAQKTQQTVPSRLVCHESGILYQSRLLVFCFASFAGFPCRWINSRDSLSSYATVGASCIAGTQASCWILQQSSIRVMFMVTIIYPVLAYRVSAISIQSLDGVVRTQRPEEVWRYRRSFPAWLP
jgi:hypothetical protein